MESDMKADIMTIDECCDFIAECKGWKRSASGVSWRWPERYGMRMQRPKHPVPPTLDSIAGALPEGWMWVSVRWHPAVALAPEHSWGCNVINLRRTGGCETYGPDEATARARAAVKAWMVVKGEPCSPA